MTCIDTDSTAPLTAGERAELNRLRARYAPRASNLTRAAQRDLALIRAGHRPDLRYGPYRQLIAAGHIIGEQSTYRVA